MQKVHKSKDSQALRVVLTAQRLRARVEGRGAGGAEARDFSADATVSIVYGENRCNLSVELDFNLRRHNLWRIFSQMLMCSSYTFLPKKSSLELADRGLTPMKIDWAETKENTLQQHHQKQTIHLRHLLAP